MLAGPKKWKAEMVALGLLDSSEFSQIQKIRKKGEGKVRRTRKSKEGKEIGRRGFAKIISKLYFNLRIFWQILPINI